MFYVEHQVNMRILIFIFIIIGLLGCTKPNPNPELVDGIYQDLKSQAQDFKKEVETEKSRLEGFKKDLNSVIPQTGAIKYAQKRYFESETKIKKLEQLVKYYELKADSRMHFTKIEYAKAFSAGKPWPTEEELASYKQYKESIKSEKSWNSKKRVTEYERANGINSIDLKTSEKPKAE